MKGAHPQFRSHSAAHKLLHALAHLFGSLVRKGQSKNPPRLIAEAEKMNNLIGEHTGFA